VLDWLIVRDTLEAADVLVVVIVAVTVIEAAVTLNETAETGTEERVARFVAKAVCAAASKEAIVPAMVNATLTA
jgi:hypothetical protein